MKKALFWLILLLAALFRLPLLQYAEFKGDEALTLFLATRPLFGHPFPPAGLTSSAGILNFPLINYLLFPIVLVTKYPPSISLVIALINVVAIGGFFLLLSKYHGKLVGFVASCLIALSPWMILYSRKIWEQDFLLPLSLPFFLSMYKILDGKRSYWLLFGVSSILLLQIHQLAIVVPFLIFLYFLISKHIPDWKKLLLGIVIGLIPTIPYFWYAVQTHFSNFALTATVGSRFIFHDPTIFLRPLQILSIGDFHTELGQDFAVFASNYHFFYLVSKFTYLAYLLLPIGMVMFWIKNTTYLFFILVILSNLLLFFLVGIEPLMHYIILLVPFIAVIDAFFLSETIKNKKLRPVAIIVCIGYLAALFLFDYAFLAMLSQKHGFHGDYGAGYRESEKGAQQALKKFKNASNYTELQLYYFLPLEYFHGYMPIAQMVFPTQELKKEEPQVEKQFLQTPTSPLLTIHVFAYYTQSADPSWDSVVLLREKAKEHPAFSFLYNRILDEYLGNHYKRLYETPDFLLLYPRHWSANQISNGVELSDDSVAIDIVQLLYQTPTSVHINTHYYAFSSKIIKPDQQNNKQLREYLQGVFQDVEKSLRILKPEPTQNS